MSAKAFFKMRPPSVFEVKNIIAIWGSRKFANRRPIPCITAGRNPSAFWGFQSDELGYQSITFTLTDQVRALVGELVQSGASFPEKLITTIGKCDYLVVRFKIADDDTLELRFSWNPFDEKRTLKLVDVNIHINMNCETAP